MFQMLSTNNFCCSGGAVGVQQTSLEVHGSKQFLETALAQIPILGARDCFIFPQLTSAPVAIQKRLVNEAAADTLSPWTQNIECHLHTAIF